MFPCGVNDANVRAEDRVEIIGYDAAYTGFLRLAQYRLRIGASAGCSDEPLYRERIEGLRAAAVLPFDPATERIVLVKQFRIGALGAASGAWLLEPPGGVIDEGESPEAAARREAWEETGCRIGDLEPILSCHTSPGVSDERVDLFCGAVDARSLATNGGRRDEGESTEIVCLDLSAAIRDLGRGMLTAATLIISVQWLAVNRRRLCDLWGGRGSSR
ncbi:MAG: NUDIX domain-containing protein [Bdellovibrio bacteriovorus]